MVLAGHFSMERYFWGEVFFSFGFFFGSGLLAFCMLFHCSLLAFCLRFACFLLAFASFSLLFYAFFLLFHRLISNSPSQPPIPKFIHHVKPEHLYSCQINHRKPDF